MDRPTTGSEAARLFVPPTNVLDTHNAIAGLVRLYASLLDEQAREIATLRARLVAQERNPQLVELERRLALKDAESRDRKDQDRLPSQGRDGAKPVFP